MRWTWRISLLLFGLLAAYTAWPFVDLYRLGRAIERRDIADLENRIEIRVLRPSISRQVFATYLRMTGKQAAMPGFLGGAAAGAGAAFIDPALDGVISLDRLADMIADALASSGSGGRSRTIAELVPGDLGALWQLYASSDYKLQNFYVSVPPAFPPEKRYRVRLCLTQWTWKLYEVELPEEMRLRLAELVAKQIGGK